MTISSGVKLAFHKAAGATVSATVGVDTYVTEYDLTSYVMINDSHISLWYYLANVFDDNGDVVGTERRVYRLNERIGQSLVDAAVKDDTDTIHFYEARANIAINAVGIATITYEYASGNDDALFTKYEVEYFDAEGKTYLICRDGRYSNAPDGFNSASPALASGTYTIKVTVNQGTSSISHQQVKVVA